MVTIRPQETTLHTATGGLTLATMLLRALRESHDSVVVDFTSYQRMTPSYANALVMTILAEHPREELRRRVSWSIEAPLVAHELSEALHRYEQGIRLSTQRPSA